jgi:hypothetical protein
MTDSADAVLDVAHVPLLLHGRDRKDVLWIGSEVPNRLIGELMRADFNVVTVGREVDEVEIRSPHARALLIEIQPFANDVEWIAPLVAVALDHGLLVVFTIPSFAYDDDAAEHEAREHCYGVSKPFLVPGRVRAHFSDWDRIASAIGDHEPKSGCNRSLQMHGDVPSDPTSLLLLRRAFWDLEGLTLEVLQSGRSGAAVWLARPSAKDQCRRTAPFLVKWNSLQKMAAERSNVSQHAANTVSFRLTPPLHAARCIEGSATGLLVFDFIDHAIPFATAIQHYPAGQLIGSLFDHTLAGCLRVASDVTKSAVLPYEKNGMLRWSDDLQEAAKIVHAHDSTAASVEVLREQFINLPEIAHRVGTVHGDMHSENLLVAIGSSDVLLIDFGKTLYEMPIVADAACLEVSMAFAPDHSRSQLNRLSPSDDANWLTRAYEYPMAPHAVPPRDDRDRWLSEALRAVRGAARQHDPSSVSYAVAIVVYLLRYASYADNGSVHDRALAYMLAARLTMAVATTFEQCSPAR